MLLFILSSAPVVGGIPARFDLHVLAGSAYPHTVPASLPEPVYMADIDARALIAKKYVKRRIPKKYRRLFGDDLYVGHILVPRTFMFIRNRTEAAWLYYMDWTPVGVKLLDVPSERTNRAAVSLKTSLNAVVAYQAFKYDTRRVRHAVRPGLEGRVAFKLQLAKALALELAVFQKLIWPAYGTVEGRRQAVMAQPSGIAAGIVLQVPGRVKR